MKSSLFGLHGPQDKAKVTTYAAIKKAYIRQAKICVSRSVYVMIRQGLERKQTAAGHTVDKSQQPDAGARIKA